MITAGFSPEFLLTLGLPEIYFWYEQLMDLRNLESHLEGAIETLSIAVALGDKKSLRAKKKLLKEAFKRIQQDAESQK